MDSLQAAEPFSKALLRLFRSADKSGAGFLTGALNLRNCTAAFARVPGNVVDCGGDDVDAIEAAS